MAKTYRPYVPEQDLLLPPSLRDWLPEDHLAFFVSDLVDHLDLSAITAVYDGEERGYPPYHPVMLTKVLVYAYCVGVFSSRKIQRRLVEDIAFRVLAAGNAPDFRTIADFRKTHLPALKGFFEQVLGVARDLGTLRVGRVAIDGSKVKANASKHKAMSYDRMPEKRQQLRAEVEALLAQAEAADAADDAEYGADRRGDELPTELQRRETRLQRIREATRALKARAKQEAAAKGEPLETAKPDPKAQYNFTDPESRIMKGPDGFVQAYNVQVAVDERQLIVGQAVTQETNDKKQPAADDHGHRAPVRPHAPTGARGRRLLLGREPDGDRGHAHRCLHFDPEAETWRTARALSARAAAEDRDADRSDVPQAASQGGGRGLCEAQSHRRAGDWPDQTRAWLPTIPVARLREGARRMVAGLHDAQYPQAVSPLRLRRSAGAIGPTPLLTSPRAVTDILSAQHEGT
jgi:transposase